MKIENKQVIYDEGKLKIYFAGPLFTPGDLAWNKEIVEMLRCELDVDIYLPQEAILIDLNSTDEDRRWAQEADNQAIDKADILIAVLHGTDIDSGTACEIGRAGYQRKPIIGLTMDDRCFTKKEQVNTYVDQFLSCIVRTKEDLIIAVKALSNLIIATKALSNRSCVGKPFKK